MQYRDILLETILVYIPKVDIFNSNVNIGHSVKICIIFWMKNSETLIYTSTSCADPEDVGDWGLWKITSGQVIVIPYGLSACTWRSYVHVDQHGIAIVYHLNHCRPCTSRAVPRLTETKPKYRNKTEIPEQSRNTKTKH